jgi:hypothetical protein
LFRIAVPRARPGDLNSRVSQIRSWITRRRAARCAQGGSSQFPWVLVGPPPTFASAIKCHQKSTSNSAGSSVGSLAPPRATPRLGGVYVSCKYFPSSVVLALRELGLRLGVKVQLPLRASSRGVLPGAGALAGYRTRLSARWPFRAMDPNREIETIGTASQPCVESARPPPSPTKSREDGAWACFRRPRKRKPQVCSFGLFHRI